ncbi:MAG: mercury(II) reductase [Geobacter sp.]|nr:mercury(II) reductase [Geobacter sp.]
MASDFDVLILGSGSTAFAAALRAHSYGARVLMAEKGVMGGTCINWGCVPSKTLIHAAQFYQDARLGARIGLGLSGETTDFGRLMSHKDDVVHHLRQTKYLDVLREVPGLRVVKGSARFVDARTVEVGEDRYDCGKVLIATGGFPKIVNFPGLGEVDYLTSRSALLLKKFPESLVVIGGGVIALELGQMFRRFGTRVTVLEHGPRILPAVEEEVTSALHAALAAEGVEIVTNVTICSLSKREGETVVAVEVAGAPAEYHAERVLLAVGTAPATSGIGLDKAGVEVDSRGFVKVDGRLRTNVPGIWAAGDVTGGMMIATKGAREGIVAVDDMLNTGCGCTMDYLALPMAIFTDPEVAVVGHSEKSAKEAGFDIVVNVMPVSAIPKAHVTGHAAGTIKMVADRATGRLLGVHLACHRGADLINEAALAVRFKLTVEDLANTMHVYPSIGEGLRLCAQGFSRDISKLSCCAE